MKNLPFVLLMGLGALNSSASFGATIELQPGGSVKFDGNTISCAASAIATEPTVTLISCTCEEVASEVPYSYKAYKLIQHKRYSNGREIKEVLTTYDTGSAFDKISCDTASTPGLNGTNPLCQL